MRKLLLLLIFSIFIVKSFATWNIKGGIDFSGLTSLGEAKSEIGFHIGTVYDLPLSSNFYFQPGLLFTSNGFKFKENFVIKKANVSMYAFEIPLILSFRPKITNDLKLLTDFGFYTRYGLFGTKKYEFIDNSIKKESSYNVYNRSDFGLNLGIGLSYNKISIIGNYQVGFTNAEKNVNAIKHKKIRLSIGYSF